MRGFSDGDIFKQTLLNKEINVFFFSASKNHWKFHQTAISAGCSIEVAERIAKKDISQFHCTFFYCFQEFNEIKLIAIERNIKLNDLLQLHSIDLYIHNWIF